MISMLIRFSGFAAATVIFLSWLINNTFVISLQEDTQALDAIRSEQADAANLAEIADLTEGQRRLFKQLATLQNDSGGNEEAANMEWVESLESSSTRLSSSAEDLQDLVTRVEPDDQEELVQTINVSVAETAKFSASIHGSADTYKQDKSAESLDALETTDKGFATLNDALVEQYGKMDAYMEDKRTHSASAAETAAFIAYLFYALGIALGGAGKWAENKQRDSRAT